MKCGKSGNYNVEEGERFCREREREHTASSSAQSNQRDIISGLLLAEAHLGLSREALHVV